VHSTEGCTIFELNRKVEASAMSSKKVYDLCVLGGGPGGWAGAVRAWDLGRKVCLVERREGLGGAAVWGGAMGKHVMQEVGKVSIMYACVHV